MGDDPHVVLSGRFGDLIFKATHFFGDGFRRVHRDFDIVEPQTTDLLDFSHERFNWKIHGAKLHKVSSLYLSDSPIIDFCFSRVGTIRRKKGSTGDQIVMFRIVLLERSPSPSLE